MIDTLIFYDYEVFYFNWLVVFINPYERIKTVIVDNPVKLKAYYRMHKDDIFVAYNGRHYDQYIFKSILLDMRPKEVNDFIIKSGRPGWQFSREFNKIQLYTYDPAKINDGGLKTLECFMGNDIRETTVDFEVLRPLTEDEIQRTIAYCTHDVEQLIEVFMQRKNEFNAHMGLITTFKLPLSYINKTPVQLAAKILNCYAEDHNDAHAVTFVDTLRIGKYGAILEYFKQQLEILKRTGEYNSEPLKIKVAGVESSFGWGGAHGAVTKYHGKGLYLHVDVESYYPLLMITYNFLTRNSTTPEKFKEIYEKRIALKKAGKKAEQAPYKIVINGTFGISKDPSSPAYDPLQANNICINGQLLLVDLIDKLEVIPGFELINENTDGLIIKIPDTDAAFNMCDDICYEWETRTGMKLAFDEITEIWQKDVNNYVFKFADGKIERKGAYVQESTPLKNDLTIVNTALVDYMVYGTPIEETIYKCNDLTKFQKVVKVSNKYMCAWHNGKRLTDKTFRVFASTNPADTAIYKQKTERSNHEKFANTPEHVIIYNDRITEDTKINIDKNYYVALARKRLTDFGIEV